VLRRSRTRDFKRRQEVRQKIRRLLNELPDERGRSHQLLPSVVIQGPAYEGALHSRARRIARRVWKRSADVWRTCRRSVLRG
jgi:hypothetical protein